MNSSLSSMALARVIACDLLAPHPPASRGPFVGSVVHVGADLLEVDCGSGRVVRCEVLESAEPMQLAVGDRVLVVALDALADACIVLGRVKAYQPPEIARHVSIEAAESLRLECGDASIELRADGKVMICGDDVLVRAKGTNRIRAGTVSIN